MQTLVHQKKWNPCYNTVCTWVWLQLSRSFVKPLNFWEMDRIHNKLFSGRKMLRLHLLCFPESVPQFNCHPAGLFSHFMLSQTVAHLQNVFVINVRPIGSCLSPSPPVWNLKVSNGDKCSQKYSLCIRSESFNQSYKAQNCLWITIPWKG